MCRNYETTVRCLADLQHCSTNKFYDTLTSGLKYMCVEQRATIEELLPCVNEMFPSIQPACERSCQADRMAAGLTMKQLFQDDIKLLKIFDNHMGRLTTNEACRVSQCMLRCYRTRMNVRCEGAAGSVLVEGLIRPYSEIQQLGSFFTPLMASFVPRECAFSHRGQRNA
ncbi:hypothetical protein M3Y97_00125600 [Aphelenchoides bicaudatus]|nr:hypothetical protein M3Y97_00125600 [Aphelenchoides bicaudatus]